MNASASYVHEPVRSSGKTTMGTKTLVSFLALTFGLSWGPMSLFMLFADQFTALFAVARSAGWLAHWREQIADNRIYRPTQIYVGSEMREYVPIDERS